MITFAHSDLLANISSISSVAGELAVATQVFFDAFTLLKFVAALVSVRPALN